MTGDFQALAAASYVSLETYRKSGAPVRTPVWITADGSKGQDDAL